MEGSGVAAVITAIGAFIVALGGLYMNFMTWKDGRDTKRRTERMEKEGRGRETKIDNLGVAVNGRLNELKIRIAEQAFENGRKFQRDHPERASPPSPRVKLDDSDDGDIRLIG